MSHKPKRLNRFLLVWVGLLSSMVGSQMTHFAMGIWAWQQTGQATPLAMIGFFSFVPFMFLSPMAGVLADRFNRKLVMAISDIGAGVVSITVLILLLSGNLAIWHLYITSVINAAFGVFKWPAYTEASTSMVPQRNSVRASSLSMIAGAGAGVIAPILAGFLIPMIGFVGIIAIDLVTLLIALLITCLVYIPKPKRKAKQRSSGSFTRELKCGFRFLGDHLSLLYLQLVFFLENLFFNLAITLLNPMILASTQGDATILGSVQSLGAIGGVAGGLILTAWGGPKKKIHGVLMGWIITGAFGLGTMGLGRALPFWLSANFLIMVVNPMLNGANQAIWQSKVAPEVQGRVLIVRRFVTQVAAPISMVIAGPLADQVFERGMTSQGHWLAGLLGPVFGMEPGAGMSLLILISGILVTAVSLSAYFIHPIRYVEALIPNHSVN